MDPSLVVLAVVIGLTVLGLLVAALLWRFTTTKTRLTWLGLALLPVGCYLAGLIPQAIGAYTALVAWWQGLTFTIAEIAGLSVLALGALLLILSRALPFRARKPRTPKPAPGGRPLA